MKSSNRFLWADVIRIVAIFLVLAAHLSYLPAKISSISDVVYLSYYAITKTCIPLFVMLSGALILPKKETMSRFYKKRLNRLLGPWLLWSTFFLFFQRDYLPLVHDIPSFLKAFIATMESFWFLPMIFALYILTPAIRIFVQNTTAKQIMFVVILWFLVVSLLPYQHDSMAFPRAVDDGLLRQFINFSGYYLLGYLLAIKMHLKKWKIAIMLFLVGLFWFAISFFNSGTVISRAYLFDYISPGVAILSAALFIAIVKTTNSIGKNSNPLAISVVGKVSSASLGVYFVHGFVWYILHNILQFRNYPLPVGFFTTIVLFIICLVTILILQKIPFLGKYVS